MGRKKIPVFSIVAADSRKARDGRYIEDLGRYYPQREPAEVRLDEDRALYWLENGAQPSDTVRSILHRRGLLLHHHLKQKGEAPDKIEEAVEEFRGRMAETEEDLKIRVETEGEDPLEKERERAEEIDEEARLRAQATPLSVVTEEAEEEAEEADEEAEAAEDEDPEEAEAETDAEAAEDSADDVEEEAEEESAEDTAEEDASEDPEASEGGDETKAE